MPDCIFAIAVADNDKGIGAPACSAARDHEAAVCVVDIPALTMRCYLLPAPPPVNDQTTATISTTDGASSAVWHGDASETKDKSVVLTQLENLLQQVNWWKGGAAHHTAEEMNAVCIWDQSRVDSDLRSDITDIVERAAHARPMIQTVDAGSDESVSVAPLAKELEEEMEARVGQMLVRPKLLQSWKLEYAKQYRWFLLAAHEVLTRWQLYDETKFEGAFTFELHTEVVDKCLRYGCGRSMCTLQCYHGKRRSHRMHSTGSIPQLEKRSRLPVRVARRSSAC